MRKSLTRVMMVEDEADIQAIARLSLEVLGQFTVDVCNTGPEALQRAAEFQPDLILLDVMMPLMDGPATLRALRAQPETAAIPVIFMTAKVQFHEIAQYTALGAIGVIHKPFDPMTLPTQIREIWNRTQ